VPGDSLAGPSSLLWVAGIAQSRRWTMPAPWTAGAHLPGRPPRHWKTPWLERVSHEQELREFLRCRCLAGGFARCSCDDCGFDRLIATIVPRVRRLLARRGMGKGEEDAGAAEMQARFATVATHLAESEATINAIIDAMA
jgi:hypothetical protein